jgi:hypothetical protein
MKIVILTSPNLYSSPIMNRLLEEFGMQITAVLTDSQQSRSSLPETLRTYLKTAGLGYLVAKVYKQFYFKILRSLGRYFGLAPGIRIFNSWSGIYRSRGVPIYEIGKINDRESVDLIKSMAPDLIVSALFGQILRKEVIETPGLGCLNFHPAHLPQYKGTSPVFWCLANGETRTGYSVHFIDEGVDTGPLLKRESIPIEEADTEHSLYMKCVTRGAEALIEAIREVEAGTYRTMDVSSEPSSYFSKPTRNAYRQFKRFGRRFFRVSDVFKKPE